MTNMRNIFHDLAGTQRITLPAISALAMVVSFYVFGGAFLTANGQSFASELNLILNPQRCGDRIQFFFNDQTGENIDPASFKSIMVVLNESDRRYPSNTEKNKMKGVSLPTLCGVRQMKVTIAYQNKKMELIIKRIPGDKGNIFLYSIPFSESTYMFDFENDLDKNCEDNVKGWHGECTISPKRIKKITLDSSAPARRITKHSNPENYRRALKDSENYPAFAADRERKLATLAPV